MSVFVFFRKIEIIPKKSIDSTKRNKTNLYRQMKNRKFPFRFNFRGFVSFHLEENEKSNRGSTN